VTRITRILIVGLTIAILLPAITPAAFAADDEEEKLGWSSTAELSYVLTAGNSETTTLGFSGSADRKWKKALLQIQIGALKAESTTDLGYAVGTQTDFTIPEITQTTAENYFAVGKYDRNITERFFWYAAAGWLRNEFAGIQDRYTVSGGVGNIWFDSETFSFRTNYGISYTDQQDIVEIPLVESSFAGVLLSSSLKKKFGKEKSEYGNDFIFNYSLADSDNWRWTMNQWVSTSLTDLLALKVTLNWLYNNVPAFREYPLLEGDPPTDQGNTVLVHLEELDTIFSVALVLKF
jgi:putative salt-induced outer membrane protein YdiY